MLAISTAARSIYPMAWRIEEQVVHGEIDNRTRGRVTGKIWLAGRDEPVELELTGNPWRDLAGHLLKFTNPAPKPGNDSGLTSRQSGTAGDITASRKVKVPECSMEELMEFYQAKQPFPWHWANSLYLEWYSETNGRVVIESATYQLELDAEPAWAMTDEDEALSQAASQEAMAGFMREIGMEMTVVEEADNDLPQSIEEAQADSEDARMQRLLDRVTARMERGEIDISEQDQAYLEERARLTVECGDGTHRLMSEEEDKKHSWIEEMYEIEKMAMVDLEAEKWNGADAFEEERHPLVEECWNLAVDLYKEIHGAGWIPMEAQDEHPLWEVQNGVTSAAAKMAGALGMVERHEEWPPDCWIAGNVIVSLKRTRGYLRDALAGLESADEENLATPGWRQHTRTRMESVVNEVGSLINEAREVLKTDDDEDLGLF